MDKPGYEYEGTRNVQIWVADPVAMVDVTWPPTKQRWQFVRMTWQTTSEPVEFYITPWDGLKLARLVVWHLAQAGQKSAMDAAHLGASCFGRPIWSGPGSTHEPLPVEMEFEKREFLDTSLVHIVRREVGESGAMEEDLIRLTFAGRNEVADVMIYQNEGWNLALDLISCLASCGDETALELANLLKPRFGVSEADAA